MKRNLIRIFVTICCVFTAGNLVATANESQRAAQANYHENSLNNGNGDSRHVSATLGIANRTHSSSLTLGNQKQDEKSIPKIQAYQNDRIYFHVGVNIGNTSVPEEKSFETLKLHVQYSENILLDTDAQVQVFVDGYTIYLTRSEVQYDTVNHTIDLSFKPEELGLQADYTGSLSIEFRGEISGDIADNDYVEMPVNFTATYKSLAGTEFVSGVTSLYYSDLKLTGDMTVENISSTSGKYRIGDELQYTATYQNEMSDSGTSIQDVLFFDPMPQAFNYDTDSLKIYSVDQAGIEKDITTELGMTILNNSKNSLELRFAEIKARTGIKIVYKGTITNDFEIPVIKKNLFMIGTDSVDYSMVRLENKIDTTITVEGIVHVDYVDENGEKLAPSIAVSGDEGTSYNVEPIQIKGYSLKAVPDNAKGMFTLADQTVSFVYVPESTNPVDPVDPIDPVKPVDPVAPNNPGNEAKPTEQEKVATSKDKEKVPTLPHTGEKISISSTVTGAIILLGALFLLIQNKKRSKQ